MHETQEFTEARLIIYINWLKNYNEENLKKSREKIIIQDLLTRQNKLSETKIILELSNEWIEKKKSHFLNFKILIGLMTILIGIGIYIILGWIKSGNIAFDACCEKMGIVDLIYGAFIYWGFQYKIIALILWFSATSQMIQLSKSQWHLINDASERIAIINTYNTFTENKLLGDAGKYMDVLLQSVFRTADDGLLKESKATLPSSFYGIETRTENEK